MYVSDITDMYNKTRQPLTAWVDVYLTKIQSCNVIDVLDQG